MLRFAHSSSASRPDARGGPPGVERDGPPARRSNGGVVRPTEGSGVMKELAGRCPVLLLAALSLTGCGPAPPDEASITGLHFTTTSAFAGNAPPTNVDVTL